MTAVVCFLRTGMVTFYSCGNVQWNIEVTFWLQLFVVCLPNFMVRYCVCRLSVLTVVI